VTRMGVVSVCLRAALCLARRYGPDRKLFLPGGLLDRSEVPAYLNGTLAGDYG
jgi:hypothetical protein